jgi:LacI family transcriptional regulator
MDAIASLGYEHKAPMNILSDAKRKIMVIVDDITNQFYMEITAGIYQVISDEKFRIAIYMSNHETDPEEALLRFAKINGFTGVIMLTVVETPELVNELKNYSLPIMLVNRIIRSLDLNSVCIDNVRGGYLATQYLIEKGHKKIAHLAGPRESTASYDRFCGFKSALEDNGIKFSNDFVFHGDLKAASGKVFAEYFSQHMKEFTAIFCANDIMAATFVNELHERGIRVPEDVSVICFDDTSAAKNGSVKLTTVAQSPQVMGQAAAEFLLKLINGETTVCQKAIFSPTLIERDSVKQL